MTIEESYETIGDDLDWDLMENLEGKTLNELRAIRKAMGHDDIEASEREFLAMLKERGLLND